MLDLTDGREYWSIYVDHAGRKTSYDFTELTEPWHGRIVSEMRAGRFVVLATRLGEANDLHDAFYVKIAHPDSAPRLLFQTFEDALAEWERQTMVCGLDMIERGHRMLMSLAADKSRIIAARK